jgi:hypothetical protein
MNYMADSTGMKKKKMELLAKKMDELANNSD